MSNRKQELDRAIRESITPLTVAKRVHKDEPKKHVTVVTHTFADAIGKAMEEAIRKQFA